MTGIEELEEIVENLESEKVIELLHSLGADRHKETADYIVFPTICHNLDAAEASEKLYYYKDNHFFYCYSEDGGMSIFTFLKRYYETRNITYNWFNDVFEVAKKCSTYQSFGEGLKGDIYKGTGGRYDKRQEIVLPKLEKGILDIFVKYYPPEWLEDGITKAAMDKYNILYSISQNKIIIPHYDIYGNLVGIRGRALNKEEVERFGKYAPVKIENKWYAHSLSGNLYGLNFNLNTIRQYRIVYVFESEKSVLQLEGFNMPNCGVAVCGSNFNKFQLNLLLQNCYPDEIIICFDKEEKQGEDKYFEKLRKICQRYNAYCKFSFIYDRENLLQMKDSPSDKGEAIFKQLLDRRVIVE